MKYMNSKYPIYSNRFVRKQHESINFQNRDRIYSRQAYKFLVQTETTKAHNIHNEISLARMPFRPKSMI